MKKGNIFCNVAKCLYTQLTKFFKSSAISEQIHKHMLHFLEFNNIDDLSSECESSVPSYLVPNNSYIYELVDLPITSYFK